jgi:hypothetical protein
LTAGIAIFFFAGFSVFSQNLVQNGNFETGNGSFADWNISHPNGDTNYADYSPVIAGGGVDDPYYAAFTYEQSGAGDLLSQNITTIPGDIYAISFNAEDGAGHNFETDFNFGSYTANLQSTFSTGPGQWLQGWTNFDYTLLATQTETLLSFLVWADTGSSFGVGDISVTQVAAPDFDGVKVGNEFHVTVDTPASYSVLVQASTNLINWVSVYTNTAPYVFTDSCTAYPRRFYRAALVLQ